MIYDRHPELQRKWDKAFWARGYYVETIGNVTEAAIKRYIEELVDGDFVMRRKMAVLPEKKLRI